MAQRERGTGVELTPPRLRILFVGHRLPPDGTGGYELHCEGVRRYLEWRLAESSLSLVERGIPALGYVGDGWLHEGPDRDPWEPFRRRPLRLGPAARWVFNSK